MAQLGAGVGQGKAEADECRGQRGRGGGKGAEGGGRRGGQRGKI